MSYVFYNPNPASKQTGDCVVRALSYILGTPWDATYMDLCCHGYQLKDMPSSNEVWIDYLVSKGYEKHNLPSRCPACYTVREFVKDFPDKRAILWSGTHLIAIDSGKYFDAWDSGDKVVIAYFE